MNAIDHCMLTLITFFSRSDNAIKNHWNTSVRKKIASRSRITSDDSVEINISTKRQHLNLNHVLIPDMETPQRSQSYLEEDQMHPQLNSNALRCGEEYSQRFNYRYTSDSKMMSSGSQKVFEKIDEHKFTKDDAMDAKLETCASVGNIIDISMHKKTPSTSGYHCCVDSVSSNHFNCSNLDKHTISAFIPWQHSASPNLSSASIPRQHSASPNLPFSSSLNGMDTTDSALRKAARSFKNTPSIIRKRHSLPRQLVVDHEESGNGSCLGSVDTTLRISIHRSEHEEDRIHGDSSKTLVPPCVKYKGKRLQQEFDKEWFATRFNTDRQMSYDDSLPKGLLDLASKYLI